MKRCIFEDFILPYSAVYLRIQKWKNYWNRSTFAKVIVKIKVASFYGPRCSAVLQHESLRAQSSAARHALTVVLTLLYGRWTK